ncbi:MAG: hypothetical protein BWZ07_00472 [Alphaproteobacteria bacterium ADurb.BinA280]|nr:MAG: hypothetical protein BWZ07_00472 [Alphaproteobacteria bacterium ADurb.BinA280]
MGGFDDSVEHLTGFDHAELGARAFLNGRFACAQILDLGRQGFVTNLQPLVFGTLLLDFDLQCGDFLSTTLAFPQPPLQGDQQEDENKG